MGAVPQTLNMEEEHTLIDSSLGEDDLDIRKDGPADTVQPGRLYSYSSEEEEEEPTWERRLRRRPRFVTRVRAERINNTLDLEAFTPIMTSERIARAELILAGQKRGWEEDREGNIVGGKRERRVSEDLERRRRRRRASSEDSGRILKRERKSSDYGSLSSLGSDLLRLDLLGEDDEETANSFISGCLAFQKTMGRLKQQSINLVQELEDTRGRVDDCWTGTNKLRSEYQRLCSGTRDLIATLRSARARMKSV